MYSQILSSSAFVWKKALFTNTIIIKSQKQYIGRLEHERHYTLHQLQHISYVQVVLSSHFHTTASSTVLLHGILAGSIILCLGMHVCMFQTSNWSLFRAPDKLLFGVKCSIILSKNQLSFKRWGTNTQLINGAPYLFLTSGVNLKTFSVRKACHSLVLDIYALT